MEAAMEAGPVNLEVLSTRRGFNTAVGHIQDTIDLADTLGTEANLGDLLFERRDPAMSGERAALVLRMLLADKLGYAALSANLAGTAADLAALAGEFAQWRAVDLVAAYHHPGLGLLTANPKRADRLAGFSPLKKRELLVIYAGRAAAPADDLCRKAAETALALFEGKRPKPAAALYQGPFSAPPPPKPETEKAPDPETAPGPRRMSPLYSVVVGNELFHNGTVEAWKRIIASYKASYPDLQVYIYYEGEQILDINSLFKWGKVKHGSAIQFSVAGDQVMDLAKLRRYLIQGASSQFEPFLHGPVSTVMKLF
jgi:hypothetical protein